MSMKSFDKFCERIILAEPGSQKEIFDERQRQQRTQLTVEALLIYCAAAALCVLMNEVFGFLESSFSGMVFIAAARFSLVEHSRACKGVSVRCFWKAGDL